MIREIFDKEGCGNQDTLATPSKGFWGFFPLDYPFNPFIFFRERQFKAITTAFHMPNLDKTNIT